MVTACIVLLYLSYSIPILCLLIRGRDNIKHGPFWMGRFGLFANIVLLMWTLFTLIMYSFPYALPVKSSNMNCKSLCPSHRAKCSANSSCRCLCSLRCRCLDYGHRLAIPRTQELSRFWRAQGRSPCERTGHGGSAKAVLRLCNCLAKGNPGDGEEERNNVLGRMMRSRCRRLVSR